VDSKLSKDYAIYWRRGGKRSASTKMESYSNNKVDWHQDFEFTGTLYRHKDHFRKKFLKFELHQVEHESKKQKIIGRALIDLGHLAKPNLVVNETQKVDVQLSQKGACTLVISIAATPQSLIKDQFGADFSAMSTVTDADDLDTGAEIDLETDSTPTTTHHADSRDIITFSTADSTKSDTMVHNLQARVAHLSDELDIEKRKRKDETSAIALTLKQAKDERDAARTQTEKFKKLYEYEKNNVQELKNTGEKLKQRSEEVHDNLKWLEIENTNFRDRLTQLEGERKKFDDQLTAERARLQAKIDDHGHSKSELETKIQKQKNLIEKLKEDSKSLSERKDEHIHALQSKLKGEQESATRLQKALDTARDDVKRAIAESSCNDNEKETQRKQMKQDLQSLGDKYTKLQDTFERQHQELESLRSKVKKYREETHQLETQLGSAHRTIEDAKFENLEQQRKIETHEKLISELEEQKTQLEKIQESHIQQKRELDTFKASVNSLTERNNMYKEENSQLTKKLVETVKFFEESSKEQRQKTEEEVQKEKQLMHDLELSNQELKAKIQEIENMQKSVTSLKNDRTQLECRIADVQHEHNALINQQDREQKEHDSKVRELNVRLQTLESESKQYQHKNSILEQENAALRTSKHSNEDHITELKSAVTSLKSSNHAQEEQISKLQSELGALTSEKDSQSSTLEKLNKTVATLEFQVEERDRRITHLREENAEIRDEMTGKHNDTDAHLDTLKTKISSLKSDRRGLEEKVATLMQDNNLIRDEKDVELSGLRAIITTLQNKHDDQEKQLVDLVHRNKTLMEELAEIKKCSSARVQEYEQRIESAHNERDKQKEEFSKLQADNEKLHRSLALAKQNNHSEFNELSQKLNALKKEHAQQTHIIQALENEKDALIQESENSTRLKEQQLEEARTCAQSLGSAKALLEKQLAELQEENVTLKKSNEPKENTIVMSVAALKSEREKYHTEISALQNEIKALRAHNPSGSSTKQNPVELQQENKTLRAENSKLNQRNAETLKSTEEASKMLKAQLKSLQEQIADLQSKEQIAVESNDQTRNELLQAREQVTYLENQHTRLQQELDETKKQAGYATLYQEELEDLKSQWRYAEEDYAIFAVLNKNVLHSTTLAYKGVYPVAGLSLCQAFEENRVLTNASPFMKNALTALEFVSLTKPANLEQMVYWFSTAIHVLKWLREHSIATTIDKEVSAIYKYDREHLDITSKAPLTESPEFVSRNKNAPGFSRAYQMELVDYARKTVEISARSFFRMLGTAFDHVKPVLDEILGKESADTLTDEGTPLGKKIVKELEDVDAVWDNHLPPRVKENAKVILVNLMDQYLFRGMVTGRASLSSEKAIFIKMTVEAVQEFYLRDDQYLKHLDNAFNWIKEACNVVSLQMKDLEGDVKSVVCPNLTDEQIQYLVDSSKGLKAHPASYSPPMISLSGAVHEGKSSHTPLFCVENLQFQL